MTTYREWDYDRGVVTEYERSGACKACGACCRAHVSFHFMKPPRAGDSMNGGPFTSERGVWSELDKGRWSYFYGVYRSEEEVICKSLTPEGLCMWQGPDKPSLCREWPISPSNIVPFPDCGYSFVEVSHREIVEDELKYVKEGETVTDNP